MHTLESSYRLSRFKCPQWATWWIYLKKRKERDSKRHNDMFEIKNKELPFTPRNKNKQNKNPRALVRSSTWVSVDVREQEMLISPTLSRCEWTPGLLCESFFLCSVVHLCRCVFFFLFWWIQCGKNQAH